MKASYDPETDALVIRWGSAVSETDEIEPGVMLDYDDEGEVIGVEVLNASQKVEHLSALGQALIQVSKRSA